MRRPEDPKTAEKRRKAAIEMLRLKEFTGEPKTNPKRRTLKNHKAFRKFVDDAQERATRRSDPTAWEGCDANILLGLFGAFHEHLYKIEAEDLADEWNAALAMAKRVLVKDFDGKIESAVSFLRWVWALEIRLYKRDPERARLKWRWVFSKSRIVDYRAARGPK